MASSDNFPVYPGWQTVRILGRGSFGAVYEIERDLFGRKEKAALKQISIPQDQGDVEELISTGYDDASITAHYESYLADIVKEYQLMAEMKGHTNVVYCDDIRYIQKDSGFGWDIYIKMELLTPMMKVLDQVSSQEQIVKLGRDIASALVLCRKSNIIHRDIKPQNIFISKDGDFKLGDFGIAKTAEKTSGGTKIGTFNYMAPEVYNNAPYGHSVDIYSLGLVLYWLLNDRRMPFYPLPPAVPKANEMEEARARRFAGEAIPAPVNGSAALKAIVLKAVAYDPKQRYQTAEELLRDLESLGAPAAPAASAAATTPVGAAISRPQAETDPENGTVGAFKAPTAPVGARTARPSIAPEPEDGTVGAFKAPAAPVGARSARPSMAPEPEDGTVGVFSKPAAPPAKPAAPAEERKAPPAEPPAPVEPPKPEAPAPAEPKKGGKKGLLIGIIGGLVALAAVLLFVLLPKGGSGNSENFLESPGVITPADTQEASPAQTPIAMEDDGRRKVLVINYDPTFTQAGGKHLHELMDWWNDPRWLADEYLSDMEEISHGNACYSIAKWIDVNDMPTTTDGQKYDLDEYYETLISANQATDGAYWMDSRWHDWGFSFDYEGLLADYGILERVNNGEIDEVWVFTGPMVGVTLYESRMVGRGAFWCNSPGLEADSRLFVIYGFSFERGVGEMLEDAGHRAESILSNVFGEPDYGKEYSAFNDWEKFTAYDLVKKDCAGVGNIHFAPNSISDYDWGNTNYVLSNCRDWENYPNLTADRETVNCSDWGNGDIRAHHKWWFSLLPHAEGINENSGMYNNWWYYFLLDYRN